jgi:hypothetical protein
MKLRAGDWIEVRTKEEILNTLDENGRLEGLPFMPEMFNYCGQRFQVYKRAHKTCDTVSGNMLNRRLPEGIHLDLRCNGQAHGGCQAGCLIFWKEAWLKPIEQDSASARKLLLTAEDNSPGCTEADVWKATQAPEQLSASNIRYVCQATELLNYTHPLKWWDARQYVEDLASGNVTPRRMASVFIYFACFYGTLANRRTLGRPARWLHEVLRPLWRGRPMPRARGKLRSGKDAPTVDLNLQPGDLVRVRPFHEILATVDSKNSNRGLTADAEMIPNCGKTYRVAARIERFVDERTGFIKKLKTPAVILEGAYCQARYSEGRLFCPRSIYTWWREIWLERVHQGRASDGQGSQENGAA